MTFDRSKLFSTASMTEKQVKACGMEFTVHVRRLPAVDLRRYHAELLSPNMEVCTRAGFDALHKAIRNADGTAFATPGEYASMDAEAIKALIDVFTEVNAQRRDNDLGNG